MNTLTLLLNEVADDESHPLADVLDYVGDQVGARVRAGAYRDPECIASRSVAFSNRSTRLKQGDLNDCAPQSRISEILAGKREISKAMAKQFGVPVAVFLG